MNNISKIYCGLTILNILAAFLFISCERNKNAVEPSTTQYNIPAQINDGWETASLTSVGMDEKPLLTLLNRLKNMEDHRIHSLLIIKDDKLVFEEYFPGDKYNLARPTGESGFDINDTHNLCSVTKSFTSALIGIAIDKDYLQSIEQKVFSFFPEYKSILIDEPEKDELTIKHLLTMTSGIMWDDESTSYFNPQNDMYQLFNSVEPIKYILSKALVETPGTVFDYANCNTNVLGEIIRKASGQRLDRFSEKYLFSKLGISDFEWQMLPDDVVFCSGDLRLKPRDMAKFGSLFLNGGTWKNERIISQNWVNISTQKYIEPGRYQADFSWADGYAFQWWLWEDIYNNNFSAYFASGWGGQWIIISPSMNMVIVSTAGNYYTDTKMPIETIIVEHIIPSISG